jgi:4a-hydroxytetrahydrobiopterin dehydratase
MKRMSMAKLTAAEVDAKLKSIPGWKRDGDFIVKAFKFKKFMEGIEFVQKVAEIAEEQEHHPDINVVWTTVTLSIQTHDEGGITSWDLDLASEIEKRLGKKTKPTKA